MGMCTYSNVSHPKSARKEQILKPDSVHFSDEVEGHVSALFFDTMLAQLLLRPDRWLRAHVESFKRQFLNSSRLCIFDVSVTNVQI